VGTLTEQQSSGSCLSTVWCHCRFARKNTYLLGWDDGCWVGGWGCLLGRMLVVFGSSCAHLRTRILVWRLSMTHVCLWQRSVSVQLQPVRSKLKGGVCQQARVGAACCWSWWWLPCWYDRLTAAGQQCCCVSVGDETFLYLYLVRAAAACAQHAWVCCQKLLVRLPTLFRQLPCGSFTRHMHSGRLIRCNSNSSTNSTA
jgi:hypothetical protein